MVDGGDEALAWGLAAVGFSIIRVLATEAGRHPSCRDATGCLFREMRAIAWIVASATG
jgi:hypothetical protein